MKNIKEQFDDFRTNTPKHVQWLLLGAAFLIVIILLTLILTHRSGDNNPTTSNVQVDFNTNPKNIEFKDVLVGKSASKTIDVSVNVPVVIDNITISGAGFSKPNNDCLTDNALSECKINVVYKPSAPQKTAQTTLVISWYIEGQEAVINTEEIPVVFSAYEEEVKEPAPVVKPIEKPAPVIEEEEEEEEIDEPESLPNPVQEIREIAIPNPIRQPEPIQTVQPPKQCSEFAIPGYDTSGRQIGWIKPERGANYFYPFSDKDCSNPTGRYDFATGVITSIKDGKKIGTDSDHIGYRNVRDRNLSVPKLSAVKKSNNASSNGEFEKAVWQAEGANGQKIASSHDDTRKFNRNKTKDWDKETLMGSATQAEYVTSSRPYDRTFILRQFKPIPATIVSEVRADPSVYGCKPGAQVCNIENHSIPVRATVDRNVYSDDGRTIILPTGTLLMGYLSGELPGPYQAFGRMNIKWYQFIRPDGVEFNFAENQDPYSADAQGRMGVPGHGSTDYIEQMVMPILTALVPAAVNMIAPITDTVINQIDLDNNTVVQSGTIRSSEMAKQDIINTWNKITQKLLVDAIDNTVPPFSIAAGTRINVFSPVDLIVSCQEAAGKKCSVIPYSKNPRRSWATLKNKASFVDPDDPSWRGQIRSFNLNKYCEADKNGKITIASGSGWAESGYDYRTVLAYCEAQNYQAINNEKQAAYNQNILDKAKEKQEIYGTSVWTGEDGWESQRDEEQQKAYNTEVLGLTYDDEGNIINPFAKPAGAVVQDVLTCDDGEAPDANGCCAGETYTDMGEAGWNCCPDSGGDCFPPIEVE